MSNGVSNELFNLVGGLNSLSFHNQVKKYKKTLKERILKALIYPIILYLVICCLLVFFIYGIMPNLYYNLSSLDIDVDDFATKMFILQVFLVMLITFFIILILMYLWLMSVKNQKWLFIRFYKSWWFSFFKKLLTLDFVWLFVWFYSLGLNTKQIIEGIYISSDEYLIKWQATIIRYKLEEGNSLIESIDKRFISQDFIMLFELFGYNNDINLLDRFISINQESLIQKCLLVLNIIKTIEYLVVGFLVVYLYQVLLLPISYLDKML